MSDYYQILGVDKSASNNDIKKAYRKLAMKYHPDQNQGDANAEEKFKEVSTAYEILGDQQKRAEYDAYGHGGSRSQRRWNPFDGMHHPFQSGIFEEFFGRRRNRPHPNPRGSDITVHLSLSFLEAVHGTAKSLRVCRSVECAPCLGAGGSGLKVCATCHGAGVITLKQGLMVIQTTCNIHGKQVVMPGPTTHHII